MHFQSHCWVNLKILGQPCGFQVAAAAGKGTLALAAGQYRSGQCLGLKPTAVAAPSAAAAAPPPSADAKVSLVFGRIVASERDAPNMLANMV